MSGSRLNLHYCLVIKLFLQKRRKWWRRRLPVAGVPTTSAVKRGENTANKQWEQISLCSLFCVPPHFFYKIVNATERHERMALHAAYLLPHLRHYSAHCRHLHFLLLRFVQGRSSVWWCHTCNRRCLRFNRSRHGRVQPNQTHFGLTPNDKQQSKTNGLHEIVLDVSKNGCFHCHQNFSGVCIRDACVFCSLKLGVSFNELNFADDKNNCFSKRPVWFYLNHCFSRCFLLKKLYKTFTFNSVTSQLTPCFLLAIENRKKCWNPRQKIYIF